MTASLSPLDPAPARSMAPVAVATHFDARLARGCESSALRAVTAIPQA